MKKPGHAGLFHVCVLDEVLQQESCHHTPPFTGKQIEGACRRRAVHGFHANAVFEERAHHCRRCQMLTHARPDQHQGGLEFEQGQQVFGAGRQAARHRPQASPVRNAAMIS